MAPLGIQGSSLAVPAPTRLSPRSCPNETNEAYEGGGAPGGVTRRREPAAQESPGRKAPPLLRGLSRLRACVAYDSVC